MLRLMAAPIPRVPPVTNATRPESLSPVLLVRSWVAVTGSSCGSGACAWSMGRSLVDATDTAPDRGTGSMVPSGRHGKTGDGSLPRRHGAPSRSSRPRYRAPSCPRVPPSGQWPALPPPTNRTAMRTPTRGTVTTAVAGLTGLCAAVLVPTVAAAHAGPEPHGWVETASLTGYSLEDNSPAGTRTTSSGRTAGGTGTFDDPIT